MKQILFLAMILTGFSSYAALIGPAGCGLGNTMMGGKENQVLAATTNGTGTQTFGITSGTSNCVDSTGVAKLEAFVDANRVALATDIARGQGDTLAGLSLVLRCRDTSAMSRVLKQNYQDIFSIDNSTGAVTKRIRSALIKESPVTVFCPGLS